MLTKAKEKISIARAISISVKPELRMRDEDF
jgi:hypothetical protein